MSQIKFFVKWKIFVNVYLYEQVNIFSNNRNIRKCQSFHTTPLQGYDYTSTFSSKTAELIKVKRPVTGQDSSPITALPIA